MDEGMAVPDVAVTMADGTMQSLPMREEEWTRDDDAAGSC